MPPEETQIVIRPRTIRALNSSSQLPVGGQRRRPCQPWLLRGTILGVVLVLHIAAAALLLSLPAFRPVLLRQPESTALVVRFIELPVSLAILHEKAFPLAKSKDRQESSAGSAPQEGITGTTTADSNANRGIATKVGGTRIHPGRSIASELARFQANEHAPTRRQSNHGHPPIRHSRSDIARRGRHHPLHWRIHRLRRSPLPGFRCMAGHDTQKAPAASRIRC